MGGGRDASGAALYKRVNGQYIRIGAYKDNEREANRLIDDFIGNPGNESVLSKYLKAIDDRDRNAVLDLDAKVKKSGVDVERKKKLRAIRDKLLELAKDEPEKVTKIHDLTNQKIEQNQIERFKKLPPAQKASLYYQWYKGKKFRLKNDVQVGADWSKIALYEPAGTEVGRMVNVKYFTSGGSYEFGGKTYDSGPVLEHFSFLMDQGNGYKKWYSISDLEVIKE